MSAPTRLQNGVNTSNGLGPTGDYVQPDPLFVHQQYDDFDIFTAADWTATTVGTGTNALVAGDGELIALTTSAGATDANYLQDAIAGFAVSPGLPFWYKAKARLSDANLSALVCGVQNVNTAPLTASATDGIFFTKASGQTGVTLTVRKAGVSVVGVLPGVVMANGVDAELGFAYDPQANAGVGAFEVFFNGYKVLEMSPGSAALPIANLANTLGILNGAAAVKSATFDYYLVAKPR